MVLMREACEGWPQPNRYDAAMDVIEAVSSTADAATITLWQIIGCAEAYFEAATDAEHEMAEAEFYRLLNAERERLGGRG